MDRQIPTRAGFNPGTRQVVVETLLLSAVLALLYLLALPLSHTPLGLGARYQHDNSNELGLLLDHAAWLNTHIGQLLAALGIAGLVCMHIARAAMPVGAALCAWVAVWCLFLGLALPSLTRSRLENTFLALACTALLLLPIAARLSRRHWLPAQSMTSPWAYPGWVLFTGLGALWLLDYAARSRPAWRFLGLEQVDVLILAYAALGLSARFGPPVFASLARSWARLDRVTGDAPAQRWRSALPWLLSALAITAVALLTNVRYPAKGAEVIRLLACVMGAWLLYRWSSQARHAWRAAVGLGVMSMLTVLGLRSIHEFGQLMVLSWAAAMVCGALLAFALAAWLKQPAIGVLTGALAACALVWAGQGLIATLAEYLPQHIQHRVAALGPPFEGKLEYLSEIRWFLHSIPLTGHGLGQVPWCGTLGSLTDSMLQPAACGGVARETHSDYVLIGLSGVWGMPVALLITAALALWWLTLVAKPPGPSGLVDSAHLSHAFGLCFVTVTLMQLLVTCLGSVGAIFLTGVNFPLLGFGGTNLLVCAVCMGVLLHQPTTTHLCNQEKPA